MAGNSEAKADVMKKIVDIIAAFVFISMMIIAVLQVIFRFVLEISVPWTEELARILYVYITFLGTILIEAENNQIKTTFIIDKLPRKPRYYAQVFLNIFSMFFLVCLFIGSILMLQSSLTMNFGTMPFLPVSVMYVPIIFSCPLVIYYLIVQLFHFKVINEQTALEKALSSDAEGGE